MLQAWLLPDSSYAVLREGWTRSAYRPRHGKPPLAIRVGQAMTAMLAMARDRYLGAAEEDAMTRAPRPAS